MNNYYYGEKGASMVLDITTSELAYYTRKLQRAGHTFKTIEDETVYNDDELTLIAKSIKNN